MYLPQSRLEPARRDKTGRVDHRDAEPIWRGREVAVKVDDEPAHGSAGGRQGRHGRHVPVQGLAVASLEEYLGAEDGPRPRATDVVVKAELR